MSETKIQTVKIDKLEEIGLTSNAASKDDMTFLEKRLESNTTSLSTLQENLRILEKTSHEETVKICNYFFNQLKTVDKNFYETHKEIDKLRHHTFILFTVYAAAMFILHLFF